jgi:hypothetical protein
LGAKSVPILFADDASLLISHANPIQFKNTINEVYVMLGDWFKKNLMSLNTMKTNYINFTIKKQGWWRYRYYYYKHKLHRISLPDHPM